jgi:HSP20 family protein
MNEPTAPAPGLEQPSGLKNTTMNLLSKYNPFRTTRWDPYKEIADFERGLDRFINRAPSFGGADESIAAAAWEPLADISEDDKEFLVKAELPEVKKEDVKVTVEDGVLRISGERNLEREEKGKKYHRVERSYGSFLRAFMLPEGADASRIAADFKDGILMVHLPKTEKAKAKAVEVKVS